MASQREKLARLFGHLSTAWIVLAVGVVLSVAAWNVTESLVEREARSKFKAEVDDVLDAVNIRLRSYEDVMFGLQGLFRTVPHVSRNAFHVYVSNLAPAQRYPGIRSLSYSQRVPLALKGEFENQVRRDTSIDPRGYPGFAVKPAGDRPEYMVIVYIEPLAGNEAGLGLDLIADARRATIERTRDSGAVEASERLILLSDVTRREPAFTLRLAVYRHDMPRVTQEQRRAAFTGIISTTVLVRDLVGDILTQFASGKIHLRIYDAKRATHADAAGAAAAGDLLFDSGGESPLARRSFADTVALAVGGRQWRLQFAAPKESFASTTEYLLPWIVLSGGLLISILLFGLIRSLATSGQRALGLANRITEDLRRSEASLVEAQRMTRELIEALPNPIFFKGTDDRYIGVNKAWETFFGIPRAAFIGRTVYDLHPHDKEIADRLDAMDQELWLHPGTQRYEITITTKDGVHHDAIYYKATFTRPDGSVAGLIGTIIDVTESKEREGRYRAMFENAAVGITRVDLNGALVDVNQKFCDMLGYTREELIGKAVRDITHPDDYGQGATLRGQVTEGVIKSAIGEKRFVRKDGATIWARRTMSVARDDAGNPQYVISVVEDITERKQAEERLAMEHAVTKVLAESATVDDAMPKLIRTMCQAMEWAYGARWTWNEEEQRLCRAEYWCEFEPEFDPADREYWLKTAESGTGRMLRRVWRTKEPTWLTNLHDDKPFRRRPSAVKFGWHSAHCFPIIAGTEVIGIMEFFGRELRQPDEMLLQITGSIGSQIGQFMARRQAEERVRHLAHYDELTGLPNRNMFNQRLGHAIDQSKRHGRRLAVLFIDLDRFKVINDTLGHDAGDELLRDVAKRLKENLRATDTVARLGGDEFVVLIEEVPDPLYVGSLAQKLIAALNAGFMLSEKEYRISASIGVSTYPDDGDDLQTLLKNADIAMYRAKDQGRNTFQFYAAQMNVHSVERLAMESAMRRALERNEFVLHYQPKVDVRSGGMTGVEALVRWQHPELGLLAPGKFIPLAEETGLIVPIGKWILRTACAQACAWHGKLLPPLRVAVNLSPRQFVPGDLPREVMRILRDTGLDPAHLELEVTESTVMHDPERAAATLGQLKAMGVSIAIDDFGTGYSSLAYLKRFPIDSVKIDRSFIAGLPGDADDAAITRGVIAMAHSLRLNVIAEGVETREQSEFLRQHGCDEIQGNYVSPPLPERRFMALLQDSSATDRTIA